MENGIRLDKVKRVYSEFSCLLDNFLGDKSRELSSDVTITSKSNEVLKAVREVEKGAEKGSDIWIRALSMTVHIGYGLAKLEMAKGDEKKALELLENAYNNMFEHRNHHYISFLYLFTVNNLCYCLHKEKKVNEAQEILRKMCEDYEKLDENSKLMTCSEVFGEDKIDSEEVKLENFESIFTKNLQMLAYLSELEEDRETVGRLYHVLLRRQYNVTDALSWIHKALNLANYFTTLYNFKEGKLHLMAAESVLSQINDTIEDKSIINEEDLKKCKAELATGWVLYSLNLLSLSEHMIHCQMEEDIQKKDPEMEFPGLELDPADAIPSSVVTDPAVAKVLCLFALDKVTQAKHFLPFETHPENYVACCLSESDIYKSMCFFETEFEEEHRLCRERLEVLETVCELCRSFELGELHVEITRQLVDTHMRIASLKLLYLNALTNELSSESNLINSIEQFVMLNYDMDKQSTPYVVTHQSN